MSKRIFNAFRYHCKNKAQPLTSKSFLRSSVFKGYTYAFIGLAAVVFLVSAGSGCVGTKRAAVVDTAVTCSEALRYGLQNYPDTEIEMFLDKAEANGDMEGCWIPVITRSLDENRDIPKRHLVTAVKVFNKRRYEAVFHKAIYRYFAALSKQPDTYGSVERQILEDYCSYLINRAASRRNENLNNAKLLCKRLDRDLYTRLFE
jgi:hypothetical protein